MLKRKVIVLSVSIIPVTSVSTELLFDRRLVACVVKLKNAIFLIQLTAKKLQMDGFEPLISATTALSA